MAYETYQTKKKDIVIDYALENLSKAELRKLIKGLSALTSLKYLETSVYGHKGKKEESK